jgi:monoamine oxidase
MQEVDIAIIGAGAAGLAAGKELAARNASFVLLEASHRIGGRGYTEAFAPDVPFDLGCHWLHSASLNPFVPIADQLGFSYRRGAGFPWSFYRDGKAASRQDSDDYTHFRAAQDKRIASKKGGADKSVYEVTERDSPWTPYSDHITSLLCSVDVDQISVEDLLTYKDTGPSSTASGPMCRFP